MVCSRLRTSPREAAMANAIAAHAVDFDDSSLWTDGRPSAAVVSAAVALGETLRSSTGQVAAAIVARLQGQACIALATGPSAYESGHSRPRDLRHVRRCGRLLSSPRYRCSRF
ncbi:MmgE/PrpD family protein [Paenarthrobacter sp. RAF54_2]|uniref:MmgE/PrpD family protein n=1 Tax=Paenarthrobacter sp. RAF54_2 TaxID=3233061 RepID=UPI003F9CB20B